MSRRWAALLLLGLLSCGTSRTEAGSRPNILFIFSDDHACQAIGAYGSKINRTPNLDRLAASGMIFRDCYVTNSICAPSRATVLTGKYSHLNGVPTNQETFDGSQQALPGLLQKAGYQTAVIGKWHLRSDPQGFDHWEVLVGQGAYYNPTFLVPGGKKKHEGYATDIITDRAIEWLGRERDPDRPFLLFYWHKAPHRDWQPAPRHLDRYKDANIPEPPTLFDDYSGRGRAAREADMTIAKTLTENDLKLVPRQGLTPAQAEIFEKAYAEENEALRKANLQGADLVRWKYQRYIKDYLRCVDALDENIGRMLDYLDRSGLSENTLVVYGSDQGFYLGEHGWFDKRFIYDESLRAPLIVRWPGVVRPGSENRDIVSNLDLAETFLDAAGAGIPSDMQGRSLVPNLRGRTPADWRTSHYYRYYEYPADHAVRPHTGVVTREYKLVHFRDKDVDEWELFDRGKDPRELMSVYADPAYAGVVARLKEELRKLQERYGDKP